MSRARILVSVSAALLLAACGSSSGDDQAGSEPTTTLAPALGPDFGVCGSLTDDEVRSAFAVPSFAVVNRNSVGCVWETTGPTGPSVSFSWYRGSPIGRERASSELIGRPAEDIEIDGHQGFEAQFENASGQVVLCESAVQYDADFIHMSVTYSDTPPTADACTVSRDLLELVASRAK
ncbi:hypothetical protein GCM10007304_08590 [Rhodococcoides trifolii]|uniref:DUF3558 domain-containing protein n=1 Tax=Rhodococcoides trifolii TaxID=908250 RepID=A0A917CT59_9NOCA|nr:DUF3558 domain-containing protein [Rhodococcus trifolii]GGF96874.1 hypothetical protein GCM10007304_08590 [Rhodococcus trifolii]